MTTALFAVPGILAPLQGLFRWFAGVAMPSRRHAQPAGGCKGDIGAKENAMIYIASYAMPGRARGINDAQIRATARCRVQPAPPVVPRLPRSHPSTRLPVSRVLRVMRVMEAGQAPASVGRMVISGRMADVCAELDRLAARESALR